MADEAAEDVMNEIMRQRARAEKAEAEATRLRDALRRHTRTFTDHQGVPLCGGCLSVAPCPDLALTEPKP